jgi:hypothetical protein
MKWRENIKKKHAKERVQSTNLSLNKFKFERWNDGKILKKNMQKKKKSNKKMRIKFDRKKPEDDKVWKKIIQMITNKVNCNKKKENQIQKTKK